jgi:hypothetical protein
MEPSQRATYKNKEVRGLLCNIPDIDAFIHQRTATYIGKTIRADENAYPKKFLAAWINDSKKPGAPQLTCNNNFANAIQKILWTDMEISKQAPLSQWIPLAMNKNTWTTYIDFYFESCRNINYEDPAADSNSDDET